MDEYILMLVMLHLAAESPAFSLIYLELWSTYRKDESSLVSCASREVKIPPLIT